MSSILAGSAKHAYSVLFLLVLSAERTHLRKRSEAESGSHTKRERGGAWSPGASEGIFAVGEILAGSAKHAKRRAFFVLARWVSHFAKLIVGCKITIVMAILPLRLSCPLKLHFRSPVSYKND